MIKEIAIESSQFAARALEIEFPLQRLNTRTLAFLSEFSYQNMFLKETRFEVMFQDPDPFHPIGEEEEEEGEEEEEEEEEEESEVEEEENFSL